MPDQREDERAVLAANASFYLAFNAGDYPAMETLWATAAPVASLHPGMSLIAGRDAVLASWRQVLQGQPGFRLRYDWPTVQLFGDAAIVYCYEAEEGQPAHLAATNVFVREEGGWRMVHHHAGPLSNPIPQRPDISTLN